MNVVAEGSTNSSSGDGSAESNKEKDQVINEINHQK
eukprot:CAMPEP_0116880878 /NCGR_PEP_ID=MMETSP0463-20121206/12899_1 /TAXON_ID=181622 /ORGANISM="Strombidinopsis sp, Strain SopsisLIS2011" /LENGTH=35 /DNA_ID= /DNA_START= /DNA_END= /DNA_ORIENTATION=